MPCSMSSRAVIRRGRRFSFRGGDFACRVIAVFRPLFVCRRLPATERFAGLPAFFESLSGREEEPPAFGPERGISRIPSSSESAMSIPKILDREPASKICAFKPSARFTGLSGVALADQAAGIV